MQTVHGEASFHLATPELDLHVTGRGGHLAPVVFHLPGRDVSPYSLSPWEPDEFPDLPPLLAVLRGDFLCFPFGGQSHGPPHGETANHEWTRIHSDTRSLRFLMETTDTNAKIVKTLATRANQHALFFEYRISGADGHFNYGNHPIIDFSNLHEGAGRVTTSAFQWGSVFPGPFAKSADGETQALAEGSEFTDLHKVKLASGGTTDLTRYPARFGNEDLVMIANQPATAEQPFAWSAAVLEGYVWFSLKNPADFPCTLLWISNAGRTAPPWNGRHCGRIGIEDVCSHFSDGVDKSRMNLLADRGIPTTRRFRPDETVTLRHIQAVAATPGDFGEVRAIIPHGENAVAIHGNSGGELIVPLDWKFIIRHHPAGNPR